jgi:hypothetical protein
LLILSAFHGGEHYGKHAMDEITHLAHGAGGGTMAARIPVSEEAIRVRQAVKNVVERSQAPVSFPALVMELGRKNIQESAVRAAAWDLISNNSLRLNADYRLVELE